MGNRLDSQGWARAILDEVRHTGGLGLQLTRLARGETLTAAELAQVRGGLVELAKVVPSLAILAAPGGLLLLPLVLRLLPSELRPRPFRPVSPDEPPPAQ